MNDETEDTGDDWSAAMNEQEDSGAAALAPDELKETAVEGSIENEKLDVILDIPVSLSLEVGKIGRAHV